MSNKVKRNESINITRSIDFETNEMENKKKIVTIWPEFNETILTGENWEGSNNIKKDSKTKTSINTQSFFEDPDGKYIMPTNISKWRRPIDYLIDQSPVIVESEDFFDLITSSEAANKIEIIRHIITQIHLLWHANKVKTCRNCVYSPQPGETTSWHPWSHIYSGGGSLKMSKDGKDKITNPSANASVPQYNPGGKYIVRLYVLGAWRKITVDDQMPFDSNGSNLLPSTTKNIELWPMILTKALLKVALLESSKSKPFGEFNVLHALTGWLPEIIHLNKLGKEDIWTLLKNHLDVYIQPNSVIVEPTSSDKSMAAQTEEKVKDGHSSKNKTKEKKNKDKEKDKSIIMPIVDDVPPKVICPQVMIFAQMFAPPNFNDKLQNADKLMLIKNELLSIGFSQNFSHPVLLTQTRDCTLEALPKIKTNYIPAWKLIRPINLEASSNPIEERICVIRIASPLINYLLNPDDIFNANKANDIYLNPIKMVENKEVSKSQVKEVDKDIARKTPSKSKSPKKNQPEIEEISNKLDQPHHEIVFDEWIDVGKINSCFSSLIIYHIPDTYPYNVKYSDPAISSQIQEKSVLQVQKAEKKQAPFVQSSQNTNLFEENPSIQYLILDNEHPSNLLISYSSLGLFVDSNISQAVSKDDSTGRSTAKGFKEYPEQLELSMPNEITYKTPSVVSFGVLEVSNYTWRNISKSKVILRLRALGTKSINLNLPPGLNVLKLEMSSPITFHLHIASTVEFLIGNEDLLFQELQKDSLATKKFAKYLIIKVCDYIEKFGECADYKKEFDDFYFNVLNCNHPLAPSRRIYSLIYCKAFYAIVNKIIAQHSINDSSNLKFLSNLSFACRVLNLDFFTINPFSVSQQPISSITSTLTPVINDKSNGKRSQMKKREIASSMKSENPVIFREYKEKDIMAAVIIQKYLRGNFVRKILFYFNDNNLFSNRVRFIREQVKLIVDAVKQNYELYGLVLLRAMFQLQPDLISVYPFYNDEIKRLSLVEFNGSYQEGDPCSWALNFKDTFQVKYNTFCVPILSSQFQNSILHVVDNDNLSEMPQVFSKVAPFNFKKNINGYTFIAGGLNTSSNPIPPGKFRLRILSLPDSSPFLIRGPDINTINCIYEFKEYYIPENEIICKYDVLARKNEHATICFKTSDPNVIINLVIYNNSNKMVNITRRCMIFIPSIMFIGFEEIQEENVNNSSNGNHYIIEASVVNNSWSMSDIDLQFIEKQKKLKTNISTKTAIKELRDVSNTRITRTSGKNQAQMKKEENKPTIDETHPYWHLKIYRDKMDDTFTLVKNMEEADMMDLMKKAWEEAEPGRLIKSKLSRQKYLESHLVPVIKEDVKELNSNTEYTNSEITITKSTNTVNSVRSQKTIFVENNSTKNNEHLNKKESSESNANIVPLNNIVEQKVEPERHLKPFDLTQFKRRTNDGTCYKDQLQIEVDLSERKRLAQLWQGKYQRMQEWKQLELINRNEFKINHLEMLQGMQDQLDKARARIQSLKVDYIKQLFHQDVIKSQEVSQVDDVIKETPVKAKKKK